MGAGAAGISLALALADSGLSVALLETGGMEPEQRDQQLSEGELAGGVVFRGMQEGRIRSLGGSTKTWYGQCIRYEPIDFESRAWIPHSGWPLTAADIEPFYARAESFFEIAGQRYDARVYDQFGLPAPSFDPAFCSMHFTIYSPVVDFGAIHQAALAASSSVRVLLHANVTEVLTNAAGTQAIGLQLQSLEGKRQILYARSVVLCAGGIENARLLLLSNKVKPAGLGNDRDLVGRFFQDHPNCQTATLETSQPALVGELFSLLYKAPLRFFPKMALAPKIQAEEEVLNCNAHFVFEYDQDSGVAAGKAIYRSLRRREKVPEFGKNVLRMIADLPQTLLAAKRFFVDGKSPLGNPRRIRFQCYLEQAPHAESRVQLGSTLDALGLPQPRLSWKIDDRERRTLVAMTNAMRAELSRLGIGELIPDAWLDDPGGDWRSHLGDAFHHIGTTRMAPAPEAGVVDRNCEVFNVEGLFIAGSSVFPTSGYGNPTLTIVALSLRLADHLKSLHAGTR